MLNINDKIVIFEFGERQLFPEHKRKEEHYVYLGSENAGNFQTDARNIIVVLTHIAWAAIVTYIKGFPWPHLAWHSWLTYYKFNVQQSQ